MTRILTTKLKIANARTRNGGARAAIAYHNVNIAIAGSIARTTTATSWAVTIGRCKEIIVGAARTNGCAMTVIASRCISDATKGSTVLETCPMRWIAVMIIVSLSPVVSRPERRPPSEKGTARPADNTPCANQ